MHLTIIDDNAHITSIRASERTTLHLLHYTLEDSRHESHINSTTYYSVDKHELTTPFEVYFLTALEVNLYLLTIELVSGRIRHTICVWLYDKVNLTKLSSTTRLLLMAIFSLGALSDSLTIWNLRFNVFHLNLFIILQTPLECAQMELTLSMNDYLTKLLALLNYPCRILLTHSGQSSHKLFSLSLILSLDST